MQLPQRKSDLFKKRDSGPIYLTEDGLSRLRAKFERLKQELPGFIAETARTAAYGDRSDNAEYKDAKSNLRRTRWQILDIHDQLKRIVIIPSGPSATGTVQLGSVVVLEVHGEEKTFRILGPRETDPGHGSISHESPLGVALMDRSKGDMVTIQANSGPRVYHILEIR